MSKSLGNAIDPVALVSDYGLDPLRYFLLREVPFGSDGDFSRKALANRLNGELADALGNLANRTLSLIQRNCEGKLPAPAAAMGDDVALLEALAAMPGLVGKHVEDQAFHLALEEVFRVVRAANGYITAQAPWALKKTDLARMEAVLRHLHSVLRGAATALQPFMPGTMAALLDQLVEGGTLVAPVGPANNQRLLRLRKLPGGMLEEDLGAVAFVPLLAGVQ